MRRQPHRNSKRLRYEKGCEPRLIYLPDELLTHVLEFAVLPEDEFVTEIWRWLGQLGAVCRVFCQLTRDLAPVKFSASFTEIQTRNLLLASLVRSFQGAPWKTAKLKQLSYEGYTTGNFNHDNRFVLQELLPLFENPGVVFPQVEKLELQIVNDGGIVDSYFLYAFARHLPCLSHLKLNGAFHGFALGRRLNPDQFRIFGKLLQKPLKTLDLIGCEMTNDHLHSILPDHGSSLTELNLGFNCSILPEPLLPDNSNLSVIREHCSQLEDLGIPASNITSDGLESFLRACSGIRHLDISVCPLLGPECIDALINYAPQLESLFLVHCDWFTDECLHHLVQGQINQCKRAGREEIPLFDVYARGSKVSSAGIRRVMLKPHIGSLRVRVES